MNKINLKLLDFIKLNKRNELYKTIFYLWKNKFKITIQNIAQYSKLSLKNIINEVDKNNGLKEIKNLLELANADIEIDNFLNQNESETYFKIIEATSIINGDFQWILIKYIFLNSEDFFIFTDFKYYCYGEQLKKYFLDSGNCVNVLYEIELFIELFINSKYDDKCFIIISDLGNSESITAVLNIAKNYKIPIISITTNEYSNLVSDSHVLLKIISSISDNPFKSFNLEISLQYILKKLGELIYIIQPQKIKKLKIKKALSDL